MTRQQSSPTPMDPSWHRRKAPGFRLGVLARLSAAYLAPRTLALGIRRSWIPFLLELMERPGQSQDALSRALSLDPAATARALSELEALGYVTRREDPSNRRQKIADPAPRTGEVIGLLQAVLLGHNEALFRGFSPQRRQQALDILDDMAANLRAALGDGPGPSTPEPHE